MMSWCPILFRMRAESRHRSGLNPAAQHFQKLAHPFGMAGPGRGSDQIAVRIGIGESLIDLAPFTTGCPPQKLNCGKNAELHQPLYSYGLERT